MTQTWGDAGDVRLGAEAVIAGIDQLGLGAVNIYMGGRFAFLGGGTAAGWSPQLVAQVAAARPGVGWIGSWVALEPGQGGYALGFQDGQDAVAAARAYPVRWLSYDVEPSTYDANPTGVAQAMQGFHDAIEAAGYLDLQYGVPRTDAAAPEADGVWVAVPGEPDPATAGLDPAFMAGRRSVQYGQASVAGIDWDLSNSEVIIGMDEATFKQWVRDVLNEGAGQGTLSWAQTSQATLAGVQANFNAIAAAKAELDAMKAEIEAGGSVDASSAIARIEAALKSA